MNLDILVICIGNIQYYFINIFCVNYNILLHKKEVDTFKIPS